MTLKESRFILTIRDLSVEVGDPTLEILSLPVKNVIFQRVQPYCEVKHVSFC